MALTEVYNAAAVESILFPATQSIRRVCSACTVQCAPNSRGYFYYLYRQQREQSSTSETSIHAIRQFVRSSVFPLLIFQMLSRAVLLLNYTSFS